MSNTKQVQKIREQMISIYGEGCWMGYRLTKKNPYTYHHISDIRKQYPACSVPWSMSVPRSIQQDELIRRHGRRCSLRNGDRRARYMACNAGAQ